MTGRGTLNTFMLFHIYDYYRYVVLIADEMKIKEDLVYDKTGHHVLGFVNLGSINDQLQALEEKTTSLTDKPATELATHMLTLMVRGIFFKLEFPYASFPTQGILTLILHV